MFPQHIDDFSSCPDVCTEVTPEVLFMRLQIWLLKAWYIVHAREICYMCTPRLHNNLVGYIVSIYSLMPRLVGVAYLFACVNVCNNRTWTNLRIPFVGAFAKLPKTTICFVVSIHSSVCPSVRPRGTTRLPLDEFSWTFMFECFRKSVDKVQVSLKSDKNKGYFTWSFIYIFVISLS